MSASRPSLLRRHLAFRRLWLSWCVSNVADSMLFLVLAVWVKDLTGSNGAAAMTFVCFGAPALIAPVLGDMVDRVSRRRLLVVVKLAIVPVLLGLLVVPDAVLLVAVYAVTVAYGAVGYLTAAAQGGLVRDLLDDDDLAAGNGLLSTVDQALRLVAPLLGTGLYALAGPGPVVVLTASCFGVAALILAGLRMTETPPTPADERGGYGAEIVAGAAHLRRTPLLGITLVAVTVGFAATGLLNAVSFAVLEHGLGVPAAMIGLVVSVQGIGAVLAGITVARAIGTWQESAVVRVGLLLLAAGTLPLMTPWLPVALVGLVAIGFGGTWSVVALMTMRQRLTPPTLQGRVGTATNVAITVPQTAVTLVGAALVGLVDHRLLLLVTAVGVALAAMLTWRRTSSTVTGFTAQPQQQEAVS
ncbi:MFS transporter [Nocardioides massiliensis]|uniref:MFS family permease n=1 Tax=Nocardioides massiliensis TaxID=1325935 RepID=A0ABT9NIS5_9ACTN|nr:MFS transporter [Nocardioides massiliensis]MDP9820261.1 MFS family permease [Nocardioides massiliensis]